MLTASMTPDADVPRPHLSVVIPIYRGEPFIVELTVIPAEDNRG